MISADKRSRWGTEVAVVPGRPGNAEGGHAESHSRGTVLLRWLTYSAAFSSSWTGATFGGFNVVDYALSATLVVFIAVAFFQRRHIHVRAWMVFPLAVAALVSAWNTIVGGADFDFVMMLRIFLTMVSVAVIVFSLSSWVGSGYLRRLLKAWVAGVALNALAAIAVSYGALSLAGILTQATGERLSGLASHPNSLAFSVCLALAPCLFLLSTESVRIVWAACLVLILWGGLLSESRAALLVGLPALALAVVVALARSQLRSFAWPVLVLGAVAAWFVVPLILADSRLAGGAGALSDAGRSTLNDSALRVFLQSPLTGAGFANQGGVAVPLTVLTAGGILFALGYYAFVLWPVPTLWAHRQSAVAPYGLITVAALIGFGVFNPVFMERATYWPILIALALCAEQRTNIGPMGPTASDQ